MKTYRNSQLEETTYEVTLDNGLTVFIHPKPDYQRTYAIFNTRFGSVDLNFVPLGHKKWVTAPQGVAHFLEHKLFEKEFGDVFELFSEQGASANAFTSYEQTAYLFSTVDRVAENLELLLDFVQTPYFTEETVEKEKGIIAQEILMYDDIPSWRIQRLMLENLYPKHPLRYDIAGTVASIQAITPEILYENYRTFYHPENMQLFITGPVDPKQTLAQIEKNQAQKSFSPPAAIKRKIVAGDTADICKFRQEKADLTRPKAMLGVRGEVPTHLDPKERMINDIALRFGLAMLLGMTSTNYLKLYDKGLIDDTFNYSYTSGRSFNFVTVECDTPHPKRFLNHMEKILAHATRYNDLNEDHLQLIKRKNIGSTIRSLDSLEYVAHNFLTNKHGDYTLFDQVKWMEDISLAKVKKVLTDYMSKDRMSRVVLQTSAVKDQPKA